MTSPRKLAANRRNARACTGPRTAEGKARVGRNARRHGLSLPVGDDPSSAGEVAALARAIAGEDASRAPFAGTIASAQVDVARVRRERDRLLPAAPSDPQAIRRLAALERYERRALSRRRRAIRELVDAG